MFPAGCSRLAQPKLYYGTDLPEVLQGIPEGRLREGDAEVLAQITQAGADASP